MKISAISAAVVMVAVAPFFLPASAQTPAPAAAPACAPMGGLNFVCGVPSPEDLVPIPGTHWLIASGLRGGGINLVDTDAKTARHFFTGVPSELHPDKKLFPNCPGPPDAKVFNAHGIYLRAQGADRYNLYVVSHGSPEGIQVFAVDLHGAAPALSWIGCIPTPNGYSANAVSVYSDGTVIATVSDRPGKTKAQELAGVVTGNVIEWKPGASSFHVLAGAELPGNNGLEISLDENEFYVVGFGSETVAVYSRKDPAKPLREVVAPGFMPDNLRWSGDRLIAAGPMYDEPACGGTRLAVVTNPVLTGCNRGYIVAELDPVSMAWTILAYSEPNPEMSGVATGVVMGNTLWIGGTKTDGVGYRPLPHPPATAAPAR